MPNLIDTRGDWDYLTCALWSSTDSDDVPLDREHDIADIDDATADRLLAEWRAFRDANIGRIGLRIPQAAHDLWLTRNGHGAGFWDGDWPEDDGDALTTAAHAAGERNLYIGDDGRIYCFELPTKGEPAK